MNMKLVILVPAFIFILNCYSSFAEQHSDSTHREETSEQKKVGLNGTIKTVKNKEGFDVLTLVTPSGINYELTTLDEAKKSVLNKLSNDKKRQIEVVGILESPIATKKLSVEGIENEDIHNDGRYSIAVKKEHIKKQGQKVLETFKAMPNTKITYFYTFEPHFSIQTDFSKKHIEQYLKKQKLNEFVYLISPEEAMDEELIKSGNGFF